MTRTIAGEVKQAARAKFSESAWLNVAAPIRDGLRRRQRDALVDAAIQQIDDPLIQNTNDLYARFLMDAEMDPCMLTSRIVFATAAVQLFVQRIFLNLEDDVHFSTEDAARWQWMKNYRLWEANVRVFVTPENWIEPELRPEKSPAFIDLENELLQNDVTLETVEIAYENYLEKLDEVGRLEVVGLYNEDDTNTLHVIARTEGTPHKYFYRKWVEARRWTPWQEVPVDIEGENVQPVIYNRRLYLFWFETMVKAEEDTSQAGHEPDRYLEIRLAWSQYRQRKWSPKRISDVWVETWRSRNETDETLRPQTYRPRPLVQTNGDLLVATEWAPTDGTSYFDSIYLHLPHQNPSNFLFANDGQIELVLYPDGFSYIACPVKGANVWSYYATASGGSMLSLRGYDGSYQEVLKNAPHTYRVTLPLQYLHYHRSTGPFFFADRNHSFLVSPRRFFGLSFAGDLVHDFPDVGVFLESGPRLQMSDILGPFLPSHVTSARMISPSLESVLHPETHAPAFGVATSHVMSAFDGRVLSGQPLTMVQGGQPIIGGDVGVPLAGLTRQSASGMAQPPVGDAATRSILATNMAEEVYVADAMMKLGVADSGWSVLQHVYRRTEYTFHSFHHPYVDVLIKQLNRYGVEGILNPREHGEAHDLRRQLMHEPDDEQFDDIYDLGPRLNDAEGMLPVEEFDFEYGRAYSIYNWELFFHIPFMIANHLTQNQRFEEAQQWYHYIFDPTDSSDVPEALNRYRFWKVKPFYENSDIQSVEQMLRLLSSSNPADLEMKRRLEDQIEDWRDNPFQPHLIAEQRPAAYQRAVVMKYLDNLIAWGDYLFRRDTRESVFEAIQLYILAAEILGKQPERIPSPAGERTINGEPVRTFNDLVPHLDEFGDALVRLETELAGRASPASSSRELPAEDFAVIDRGVPQGEVDLAIEPPTHEIIGSTLFFCIPPNEKLLGYWDTVADRLFKIRHCMNIEGVVRSLDLFAPPIDPAMLVRAAAAGLDLGSVLNDLNAPRPHYRFQIMAGKALELCNEVKALGSALLQALEKKDAEELSLLRQTHEQNLLQGVKLVRERQIAEAKEAVGGLKKTLESAQARHEFYANRKPLIENEKLHLKKMESADMFDTIAQGYSLIASRLALIPEFDVGAEGGFSSPTVKARFGGDNLSKAVSSHAQMYSLFGLLDRHAAQRASIKGGYERRQEEWDFSAEQAGFDSEGIERQLAAAEIRIAVAEQELRNHETQIEQSREVDEFMRLKFANHELYSWMVTQTSGLYFQAYGLAYDVAKRAERAFQHELAQGDATFVTFGHWDSLKEGLLAGERLALDLRRMETAYLERNRRELELTKYVSLRLIDSMALIQLRETGACEFEVPEALFNLDFPSHYMRRLKSVALTIPSVVGPYAGVHATLTLLSNRTRVNTVDPHEPYAGAADEVPQPGARFVTNVGGIQAIATSSGREDGGLFELNLRDERYLPFEGAGVIGRWRIELNDEYRAFDYDSISDVNLLLRYTARDGGAAVRQQVVPKLAERVNALVNATAHTGLFHFISLRREFGSELHRFLHPSGTNDHEVTLTLLRDHYPYLFQGRTLTISRAILLLKLRDGTLYDDAQLLSVELSRAAGNAQAVDLVKAEDLLGGLPVATYEHVAGEVTMEESWRLHVAPAAVAALPAALRETVLVDGVEVTRLRAEQIEDLGLLLHYGVS
ncbi:MAG TPA: neuraminidase-like domain-containing protein [Trueperaceae bacterium]|nr:neuraminidase-like domain-containing protein [Trueperaceae bacterium]